MLGPLEGTACEGETSLFVAKSIYAFNFSLYGFSLPCSDIRFYQPCVSTASCIWKYKTTHSVAMNSSMSPSSRSLQNYAALLGMDIPEDLVDACAELFSTNYGVWGGKAGEFSKYTKPGPLVHAVRMILTYYLFTGQRPRGILFHNEPEAGVISSVYTAFFVDHDEPLRALEVFKFG
jgi:hypothetical protein